MRLLACCIAVVAMCMTLPGCERAPAADSANPAAAAADAASATAERCPHDIRQDRCPFCTPALVEADGFCGEHGVAEALCYLCRPYLKTAFRAKGDWCAEHNAPDSQCMVCHPELKENINPALGHGH